MDDARQDGRDEAEANEPWALPLGTRVRLVWTSDPHTRLRQGTSGTLRRVQLSGGLGHRVAHVQWDDGSSLSLLEGAGDQFEAVPTEEVMLRLLDEAKDGLAGLVATELGDVRDDHETHGSWGGPSDGRGRADDHGAWHAQLLDLYKQLTGHSYDEPADWPETTP